ncbi:hypothetical protein [Desulfospira joergensenii]|uniref:hypothetical protein n=1 Tax=Desulfospira joergensenii TaxID=53329 RepID=UPI0012947281|nr:hypothetical protein [Desulfospira joergensenii]
MTKSSRLILTVLLIGLGIHGSCAWAEGSSPEAVAKKFTKAYFMLDNSMAGYLSEDARVDEEDRDAVEVYLRIKEVEAENRGYGRNYLRMLPLLIKTEVKEMDDSSASVKLDAVMIRSINPLYRIVGYIFCLLQEHEVETVINLIKEDGEWKIGPGAFDMPV